MYFQDIKKQLIDIGIDEDDIKNVNHDPAIGREIWDSRKEKTKETKRNIANKLNGSLLIVINSLRAGGAEKSLINLLELLGERSIPANVISIYSGGVYCNNISPPHTYFDLFNDEDDVRVGIILNTIPLHEIYNDMVGIPFDTIVAFLEGPATLFSALAPARKRISWCHTDLNENHWTKFFFRSYEAERDCYNVFDELVFVSPEGLQSFCRLFPDVPGNKRIIPNTFNVRQIRELSKDIVHFPGFTFISVGRLCDVKGFDRLIDAFYELCKKNTTDKNLLLIIIGEGVERDKLQKKIESKNSRNKVILHGFDDNPYKYIAAADVYISSSHVEGHPLSIGEAMLLSKPIIATDNFGSNNILNKGEFGLIVENSTNGIYSGMLRAINDKDFICEYSTRATYGQEQFRINNIVDTFLDLIK